MKNIETLKNTVAESFAAGARDASELEECRTYAYKLGRGRVRKALSAGLPSSVDEIAAFLNGVRG